MMVNTDDRDDDGTVREGEEDAGGAGDEGDGEARRRKARRTGARRGTRLERSDENDENDDTDMDENESVTGRTGGREQTSDDRIGAAWANFQLRLHDYTPNADDDFSAEVYRNSTLVSELPTPVRDLLLAGGRNSRLPRVLHGELFYLCYLCGSDTNKVDDAAAALADALREVRFASFDDADSHLWTAAAEAHSRLAVDKAPTAYSGGTERAGALMRATFAQTVIVLAASATTVDPTAGRTKAYDWFAGFVTFGRYWGIAETARRRGRPQTTPVPAPGRDNTTIVTPPNHIRVDEDLRGFFGGEFVNPDLVGALTSALALRPVTQSQGRDAIRLERLQTALRPLLDKPGARESCARASTTFALATAVHALANPPTSPRGAVRRRPVGSPQDEPAQRRRVAALFFFLCCV
mmetsp:Transcript_13280/g.40167  ORF Transcript_13280/g.40167 Transcript_13280/m.40167 type:complete len:409 (+) Transcript_13280:229-1455(+)